MDRRSVSQAMQAKASKFLIYADRTLAGCEAVCAPTFGVEREKVRIRVACTGQRGDIRTRGFAERHGAQTSLRTCQTGGGGVTSVHGRRRTYSASLMATVHI